MTSALLIIAGFVWWLLLGMDDIFNGVDLVAVILIVAGIIAGVYSTGRNKT